MSLRPPLPSSKKPLGPKPLGAPKAGPVLTAKGSPAPRAGKPARPGSVPPKKSC